MAGTIEQQAAIGRVLTFLSDLQIFLSSANSPYTDSNVFQIPGVRPLKHYGQVPQVAANQSQRPKHQRPTARSTAWKQRSARPTKPHHLTPRHAVQNVQPPQLHTNLVNKSTTHNQQDCRLVPHSFEPPHRPAQTDENRPQYRQETFQYDRPLSTNDLRVPYDDPIAHEEEHYSETVSDTTSDMDQEPNDGHSVDSLDIITHLPARDNISYEESTHSLSFEDDILASDHHGYEDFDDRYAPDGYDEGGVDYGVVEDYSGNDGYDDGYDGRCDYDYY